ncbi:hypothetical protein OO012_05495 [Rhodobacteraceae bacterium KMM 6894]|nr:hypothetical protein [Rhodobacteraceae bacterium KMM 6894]
MFHIPRLLTVATTLVLPTLVSAQSLTCPDAAEVFAVDGGARITISVPQLARIVAGGPLDDRQLREVAQSLRMEYPKASDAEIADLMITGYCAYLRDDAPDSLRTEDNLERFETRTYEAVFGTPTPTDKTDRGWLFN